MFLPNQTENGWERFGETKEALFQYKLNYRFPQNGKYSVKVTQAMRRNVLPGIEDLGIKIQNVKP